MDSSAQISTVINGTTCFRRNKKFTVFFSLLLLILLLFVFSNTIFSPSILRKLKSIPFPTFTPSPYRSHCRLTPYEDLCYDSISSSLITTPNPDFIFLNSIQFAVNELNATATSIEKAVSTAANASLVLSNCLNGARESLRMLNTSLGFALEITWFPYEEATKIKVITRDVKAQGLKCLKALREEEKEKLVGVKEVKFRMEKAINCVSNIMALLNSWDNILIEFYESSRGYHDYVFSGVYLVWLMYGAMYVFIAVLYVLFWRM